ncbi:MAG TPA: AAA family ATPase, partial [Candidatus Limnocylindrales bacterium]|nr:AAA family ATPase [Candidatus Limnocylindrales bacterium]
MSKAEGTLAADEHDRISNSMPRPSVIGRERELALVEQFLRERSWPGILQLDGDAGIGKTTIWSAACAMAVEAGALLLVCRPAQAEVSLAFAGLVDLFESVPDALLRVLPEAQQAALATALRRRPPSRRLPDPLAVSAGVRAALANLALSRPVVVAIDDVQWIDPSTAAVLDYVLRRLTDESIGFLLAHRSASIPGTSLATDRIVPTRIAVEPLSLSSLHHVIRTRAGRVLARPVLRRVADASGGNPLLA